MYLINSNRIYHHVYAILNDDNKVNDIIYAKSQEEADYIAKNSFVYGKAFCIDYYPLEIGDIYINRKFYRPTKLDETSYIEIAPIIEEDDKISNLELIIEQKNQQIKYLEGKLNEASVQY